MEVNMDLLVLAGGMGSRFGGLKQIQPIDADNNFIIDYSIYDAIKAGFDRVIFIIKEENYEIFESTIGKRLKQIIPVEYVLQSMDFVPEGTAIPDTRVKPWGTAHAIYAAKDVVSDRFAIINADDFYGYDAYKVCADFLRGNANDEYANIGFRVKNTLSEQGAVKRGILTSENGKVSVLTESEIEKRDGKIFATPLKQNDWHEISANTLVSMNMFAFTDRLMDQLEPYFVDFFANEDLEKGEFLIPIVINDMLQDGSVDLKVLPTSSKWYGITYREDLDQFKQAIQRMIDAGEYPAHLYDARQTDQSL